MRVPSLRLPQSLTVPQYSTENLSTFSSAIALVIAYLCRHSWNRSLVVRLPCSLLAALSAKMGVPVKPNIWAWVKNLTIFLWVSPNWDLWHSSKMNTMRLSLRLSIAASWRGFLRRVEFLDSGDNEGVIPSHLFYQLSSVVSGVYAVGAEIIKFSAGLVVKVSAIDDKQHFLVTLVENFIDAIEKNLKTTRFVFSQG
jgi:hypothetical protein